MTRSTRKPRSLRKVQQIEELSMITGARHFDVRELGVTSSYVYTLYQHLEVIPNLYSRQ